MKTFLHGLAIALIVPGFGWAQSDLEGALDTALIGGKSAPLVEAVRGADAPDALVIGRTPLLLHAALGGDTALVAALLDAGLSVDVQGPLGETALMLAVERGDVPLVQLLMTRGAKRALRNGFGLTAAQIAAQRGDNAMSYRVLPFSNRKAFANDWLLEAAARGDREALRYAMRAGADLDARTDTGQTIVDVALEAQQWATLMFVSGMPTWSRDKVLGPPQVKRLIDLALSQPAGSTQRKRAALTLASFLSTGVTSAPALSATAFPRRDASEIREIMADVGLSQAALDAHFPRSAPALPPLEFTLPMRAPAGGATVEDWKNVQRRLADEGLYLGAIDGLPGPGTYDALYAYVLPLVPIVKERAERAARLARNTASETFGAFMLMGTGGTIVRYSGERVRTGDIYRPMGYAVGARAGTVATEYLYGTSRETQSGSGTIRDRVPFFSVTCDGQGNLSALRFSVLGTLMTAEGDFTTLNVYRNGKTEHDIPGGPRRFDC